MRRGHSTSQPPGCQGSLSTRRVTVDPVDGLSGQTSLPGGNLSHAHRLSPEHGAHLAELLASICRLTAEVSYWSACVACSIPARCAALWASASAWEVAAMRRSVRHG